MAEYELSEVAVINTNKARGTLSKHCLWVETPPAFSFFCTETQLARSSTSAIAR